MSKTAEVENKLTSIGDRFDNELDMLFAFFIQLCASNVTEFLHSGGLDTQREQSSDNVSSAVERRSVISLNSNLDGEE